MLNSISDVDWDELGYPEMPEWLNELKSGDDLRTEDAYRFTQ